MCGRCGASGGGGGVSFDARDAHEQQQLALALRRRAQADCARGGRRAREPVAVFRFDGVGALRRAELGARYLVPHSQTSVAQHIL